MQPIPTAETIGPLAPSMRIGSLGGCTREMPLAALVRQRRMASVSASVRVRSRGSFGIQSISSTSVPPAQGASRRHFGSAARKPESPRALRGADEGREPPNSVRAVASTSGLRYVACTATQTSPDLPVCLRWLQEPSACTSSAQLLSRHLSRSSCTTAESDDQPCTWARLSTHETAAGGLCFRRASWTLLVAAPEARRGPTPDAVRAERGVTRLPLLEPRGSPSRGGRVPDGRVPIGQFDRPRTQ